MPQHPLSITGDIYFKIRFNTAHGDTDFYWRIIVAPLPGAADAEEEQEYLARSLHCKVDTYSESSYDKRANAVKYHIAGRCATLHIDEHGKAEFCRS